MHKFQKVNGILAILLVLSSCATKGLSRVVAQSKTPAPSAWVQMGSSGLLSVRTIVSSQEKCPDLQSGEKSFLMTPRGANSQAFPDSVCEAQVSTDASALKINSLQLPSFKIAPEKIVVIGDTGCKVVEKKGVVKYQNCNSEKHWPFAQIAKAAADWHPDLVIHVGDYHYRETACPDGNTECEGSLTGDNLPSWQQDFLTPAEPLLKAAPWVFVRGNHELCARGGNGWFKLLDPRPFVASCTDQTEPYWIDLGHHSLAVIDSADDKNIQPSLEVLPSVKGPLRWLVLHRPFLTTGADDETTTSQTQLKDSLQDKLSFVLAGHQHRLSLNQFPDRRPPELITGNGGTKLEKPSSEINPSYVYRESADFGFLTLEKINALTWQVVEHDRTGAETIRCVLAEAPDQKAILTCE